MEEFKDYIISEYKPSAPCYVAAEFKFAYSTKIKIDKKSGVSIVVNIIKVGVKLYDKDMNVLVSKTITFENNVLSKTCAKRFVNISPAETENKFNAALTEISDVILGDYVDKLDNVQTQIHNMNRYVGREGITAGKFKGERIQIVSGKDDGTAEGGMDGDGYRKKKVVFDM